MYKNSLIMFVINVDWFFLSHYLSFALAAREHGASVTVVAGDTGKSEEIRSLGFGFVPLPISRSSLNPWVEARTLWFLWRLYRRLRPDLVHQVTIKPVIYGSLAARAAGNVPVANTISGMGHTFANIRGGRLTRPIVRTLYRAALAHSRSRTVFHNQDDLAYFTSYGLIKSNRTVVVPGSGVDCSVFQPVPEPEGSPTVMLASRMLWDKGVGEYVDSARSLHDKGCQARFVLVGDTDPGNPAAISTDQLETWVSEGVVEWWGFRGDMPKCLAEASIVVLPSYREGFPKVLLEAGACARPLVATDVPGCRGIVRHGENGFLVPPHDSAGLADAIHTLVQSPEMRQQFGRSARELVEREFTQEIVVQKMLDVYRELLGNQGLPTPLGAGVS